MQDARGPHLHTSNTWRPSGLQRGGFLLTCEWSAGPLDFVLPFEPLVGWPQRERGAPLGVWSVSTEGSVHKLGAPFGEVVAAPVGMIHEVETRRLEGRGDAWEVWREVDAYRAVVDHEACTARYQGMLDFWESGLCPVFESFLRVVSAGWLLRNRGALFHGASAVINGQGYLFAGFSGAGKSTLVEGTPDDVFLADDQSLVTWDEEQGHRIWGSPFAGNIGRRAAPTAHPLRAVVLLMSTRPSRTRIERLHPQAAVAAELMRHVCSFERSSDEARRAFDSVQLLLEGVPLFRLERHLSDSLPTLVEQLEDLLERP